MIFSFLIRQNKAFNNRLYTNNWKGIYYACFKQFFDLRGKNGQGDSLGRLKG